MQTKKPIIPKWTEESIGQHVLNLNLVRTSIEWLPAKKDPHGTISIGPARKTLFVHRGLSVRLALGRLGRGPELLRPRTVRRFRRAGLRTMEEPRRTPQKRKNCAVDQHDEAREWKMLKSRCWSSMRSFIQQPVLRRCSFLSMTVNC